MCFTFDVTFRYAMRGSQAAWAIWRLWCTSLGGLWNNMVNKRNVNRLSKHTMLTATETTTTTTTTPPPALAPPPKIETIKKIQFRRLLAIFVIGGLIRFCLFVYSSSLLNWIALRCCWCRFFRMRFFFTWILVVYEHSTDDVQAYSHRIIVIVIWESRSYEIRYMTTTTTIKQMTQSWMTHLQHRIGLNYAVETCKIKRKLWVW